MSQKRYTVAVDFDGVLHSYASPWVNAHTIPDPPVRGAVEWLYNILQDFDVVIFTTRAKTWRGRRAVRRWLRLYSRDYMWRNDWDNHQFGEIVTSYKKLPALVYIDDRGWRFDGTFPTADQIHRARPWNKPRVSHG